MFTLALMFMIVALVMLILYMFVDRAPKNVVLIVACTTCFMACKYTDVYKEYVWVCQLEGAMYIYDK